MKRADTITGFEEAMWAWVSANYLKNTLQVDNVNNKDFSPWFLDGIFMNYL